MAGDAGGAAGRARTGKVRISAIVDARFRLIVDGVSARSWTIAECAQATGFIVSQSSTIGLKRPCCPRRRASPGWTTGAEGVSVCGCRCRLVHGGGRRLRRTTPRWASRVQRLDGRRAASCAKRSLVLLRLLVLRSDSPLSAILWRAVHDAVEDRVGEGRIVQPGVPGVDRQLAGDQGRASCPRGRRAARAGRCARPAPSGRSAKSSMTSTSSAASCARRRAKLPSP